MKKSYRLGLDMGTNSLGWTLWELGTEGPEHVLDMGVRIFSDGREPGRGGVPGEPLAVKRRNARGIRRRRDRFLQRKRILIQGLIKEGLWPEDPDERSVYSALDPYKLRSKSIHDELSKEELGRVLLHLCQRRGFKSNRKDASKDDEKGMNKQRMMALDEELSRNGIETLGEYFNSKKRQGIRFREGSIYYPNRQHYIKEFNKIRDAQKSHHPSLNWKRMEHILFYQRPLAPQKKGKCRFYTDHYRASKSLPSSHRFRILQEIANLRMIGPHGETIGLSNEEHNLLYHKLENQKTISFGKIRKLLNTDNTFNLEDGKRDKLLGNSTSCILRQAKYFGSYWDDLDEEAQDRIVEFLTETAEENDLRNQLAEFRLSEDQQKNLIDLTFPVGMSRVSAVFQRECVRLMKNNHMDYSEASKSLGFDHRAEEGDGSDEKLPYYGEALPESCIIRTDFNQNDEEAAFGKISNPTVHIAMNQLRKVVNAIIDKHGKPQEIVIELARELKVGNQTLSDILSEQKKNQKRNEQLDEDLHTIYKLAYPSRADREKLLYYMELMNNEPAAHCPYCRKVISAEELFTNNIEVEHILPFSRTLDDGRNNKTIAHRTCNAVKRERSPYEAFGSNPTGYDWDSIQAACKNLPKPKQRKFQQDAMQRFEENEAGFIKRQLTDNAYISRIARRYLTTVCPPNKIWGVTGRQTAILRRKWNINSILSRDSRIKNRSDHRHHAIDAAVIALIDRSLLKRVADANRRADGNYEKFHFKVPDFPDGEKGIEDLKKHVREILPSIKPDHGLQGRFFKETAYGKIRLALLLDTDKLTENIIPDIASNRIRYEMETLVDSEGFRKARKKIKEKYAKLRMFQNLWVTSKPLTGLEESDLQPPTYGNNTKGPSNLELRKTLLALLESRPGEKSDKILEEYGKMKGIRHIRYIPKNQEITAISSSPGKGYELDDFAYVEIWSLPPVKGTVKYEGTFISRLEANQIEQGIRQSRRPHPAAKKIMRLFKQDTIATQEEDGWKYYRVAGFKTKENRIDIQPIWLSDIEWHETINSLSLKSVYPKGRMQNYISINTLWKKPVKKIAVHYDGSIR